LNIKAFINVLSFSIGYILIINANLNPNFNNPLIVHASNYKTYNENIKVPINVTPVLSISVKKPSKNICTGSATLYSVNKKATIWKNHVSPNIKNIIAEKSLNGHYILALIGDASLILVIVSLSINCL